MIATVRNWVQIGAFFILMYGGKLGINFGNMPCFACPFLPTCGGYCFLLTLQRIGIFGLALGAEFFTKDALLYTIKTTLIVIVYILLFSKMWCGWLCPFGTLQDWLSKLRKKLGISELVISWKTRERIKKIKYVFLGLILVVPFLVAYASLHNDLYLLFCKICPARVILPLFAGYDRFLGINTNNIITIILSMVAIGFAVITVVGSFFKDRFFCMVCPMLPIIQLFKKYSLVKFEKDGSICSGCGNCERNCPVDIRKVHLATKEKNVMEEDCILCFSCLESCPENEVLKIKIWKYTVFSSSKAYALKKFLKEKINGNI